MCFKSKFDKLKREDVVDAICKLETEGENIEKGIIEKQSHIVELTEKGKAEKNREIRLFYAKKINSLKEDLEQDTQTKDTVWCLFCLYFSQKELEQPRATVAQVA